MFGILSNYVFFLALLLFPPQSGISSEITFCHFDLPDAIKRANAGFNVSYDFEIGEDGKPIRISKLINKYVSEAQIISCLQNWSFQGVPKGTHLVANFYWKHADGWIEVAVSGPDFLHRIKISGDRCPYLRMQTAKPSKSAQKNK
jgi:hypothetical protein